MDGKHATYVTPPAGANAWAEPHPDAPSLPRLGPGERVEVLETRGVWVQILTETGRQAWIDGRRLQPHEPPPSRSSHAPEDSAPPLSDRTLILPPGIPPPPAAPPDSEGVPVESHDRRKPVPLVSPPGVRLTPPLVAPMVVILAAFPTWFRQHSWSGMDTPLGMLIDPDSSSDGIPLGALVLLLGALGVAASLVGPLRRYRRVVGGAITAVTLLFLIQALRHLNGEFETTRLAVGALFTDAVAPWAVLIAGIAMVVRK